MTRRFRVVAFARIIGRTFSLVPVVARWAAGPLGAGAVAATLLRVDYRRLPRKIRILAGQGFSRLYGRRAWTMWIGIVCHADCSAFGECVMSKKGCSRIKVPQWRATPAAGPGPMSRPPGGERGGEALESLPAGIPVEWSRDAIGGALAARGRRADMVVQRGPGLVVGIVGELRPGRGAGLRPPAHTGDLLFEVASGHCCLNRAASASFRK